MPTTETYAPKTWTPTDWQLASPVLRDAARAGGWGSDVVEYNVLISLTAFVQATWPAEQRDVAPDLKQLLRPSAINLYINGMVAAGSKPRPAATRRSHLRRTMDRLKAICPPGRARVKAHVPVDLLALLHALGMTSPREQHAVRAGLLTTLALGASQAERAGVATCTDSALGLIVHLPGRDVVVRPDAAASVRTLLAACAGGPLLDPAEETCFAAFLKAHSLTPPRLEALWLTQHLAAPALPSQLVRSLRPNHTARLSTEAMDVLKAAGSPLLEASARRTLRGCGRCWSFRPEVEEPDVPERKPGTRRGSARQGKALIAAAKAARASEPSLEPGLEEGMHAYKPRCIDPQTWQAVRPLALRIVRRCHPTGAPGIRRMLTDLAPYLAWAKSCDVPMDLNAVCDPDLLEAWTAQLDLLDPATRRSRLRRMLLKSNPCSVRAMTPAYGRRQAKPAYTCDEVQRLIVTVRNQGGRVRRGALIILALGLGAGFDGRDLKGMTTDHVIDHGEHGIQVISGGSVREPRMVWLRCEFEPLLREALVDLKPGQHLIKRQTAGNHNVTDEVVAAISASGTGPRLDPSRCRSTWLTSLLVECAPLGVVLAAAGISTATTLVELARALEDPSEDALRNAERGWATDAVVSIALSAAPGTSG